MPAGDSSSERKGGFMAVFCVTGKRRNFNGQHAILNGYGSMAGARHDAAEVPFVEVIGACIRL
ncbi:MAG TPA: hypothetical protein DC050_07895 [Pseudomonas sp.]|nr:hypothetical protein [Pseudomonas sp.]